MTQWTEEMRAVVREGYAAKRKIAHIAEVLGVSRNAVIGQARRMDLQKTSRNPTLAKNPLAPPKPKVTRLSRKPRLNIDLSEPDRLLAKPAFSPGCKWIFAHPEDEDWPNICGGKTVFGYPYCMPHCLKAYIPKFGQKYQPEHFLKRAEALKE